MERNRLDLKWSILTEDAKVRISLWDAKQIRWQSRVLLVRWEYLI